MTGVFKIVFMNQTGDIKTGFQGNKTNTVMSEELSPCPVVLYTNSECPREAFECGLKSRLKGCGSVVALWMWKTNPVLGWFFIEPT